MLLLRITFLITLFVSSANSVFAQDLAIQDNQSLNNQQTLNNQKLHEDTAQEIYYETLSPFCPGRALADCPTEQSRDLKAQILKDLQAGRSKQEIIDKFLKDYGQHLSSIPGFSGLNMIAWLLPVILVLAGLIIVIRRTQANNSEEE